MASERILVLHNRYREPGGEDAVAAAQVRLLREKGHAVRYFEKDNRQIDRYGIFRRAALFFQTAENTAAALEAARLAAEFKPQVALVHNTLPLLSPAVYAPLRRAGCKVVQFLHNYRLVCAAGTLYRAGQPCTLCLEDGPRHAATYRCWRNSLMATLAFTRMLHRHRLARTWHTQVDLFVALNEYMRALLVQAGAVPAEKIIVQPNFAFVDVLPGGAGEAGLAEKSKPEEQNSFVFMGRDTPEKGLATLLKAQALLKDAPLKVIGADAPASGGGAGVAYLGYLPHAAALREIAASRALVFPSEWQEPFGLSVIEAMALGKPVIASRVAGPKEIVRDGNTGLLFEPGDAAGLAECMRRLREDSALALRLGAAGRERYLREYAPEAGYRRLQEIWTRLGIFFGA